MAVRTNNRLFPMHLWLLTAGVVGPVLLVLGSGIYNSNYFNNSVNIGVVLLFIPFGLLFSLPTFIVVWLAHAAVGQKLPVIFMKLLLMSIAIVGVFITFSLIGGSTAKTYSLFYAAGVVLSGMILRVETS